MSKKWRREEVERKERRVRGSWRERERERLRWSEKNDKVMEMREAHGLRETMRREQMIKYNILVLHPCK